MENKTKTLETKHLILRKFKDEDYLDVYNNYASSEEVTKYVTWSAHKSPIETKDFIESVIKEYEKENFYHWAIEAKGSKEVIGAISIVKEDGVCGELGYCLGIKYWNKGYMSEAASKVLEYLFENNYFEVMIARHIKENIASGNVLKKAGFEFIGEGVDRGNEVYIYKCTKDNYKQGRVKYLLSKIYKEKIRNFKYYTFGYQQDYRKNEQICYGYIPFIDSINPEIIEDIIQINHGLNRPGILRESTEYVTIHDTASASPTAGAKAHNNWIHSMANDDNNKTCVSWHYTIADKDIYQHLPLDEVGYHAGDGTGEKLKFTDTGIKASRKCEVTISDNGNYFINGMDTNIKAPLTKEGEKTNNINIPYNGIAVIINENGNFSIGNTWWSNSYKMIGNRGGNLNSVGIETCVNLGSNYINTMRNTAYITGKLLDKFDLTADRVKQHNFFSGKDCPMTIRHAGLWEEFIDIVKIEKYRNDYLKDAIFKFESLTLDLLDNEGNIIKYEEGAKVRYKVIVNLDNVIKEYEYESILDKKMF